MTSSDRLPPRRDLPPGVVIVSLPGLGKTWYERGFSYWARRVGMQLLLLAGLALYLAIISGVVRAAGPPGSAGFLAVLVAEAAFTLVTAVLLIRHSYRAGISGRLAGSAGARTGSAGAGWGLLAASAGGPAGAVLIALAAVFSAGFMVAVNVLWLLPVLPAEQHARRQVAEALRIRFGSPHTR